MATLKALIVDDEMPGRENLKSILVEYFPYIQILGTAESVSDGLNQIAEKKPNVVFLDMELGDGTGIDLLSRIKSPDFYTVFVTAYDHYAIKAFRADAVDYILKPIDISELEEAIGKVTHRLFPKSSVSENMDQNILVENEPVYESGFLRVNTEDGTELVSVKDIVFLKSLNYYTKIVLNNDKTFITTKTLKDHEKLLKDYPFARIHQSFMININFLKSVEIKEKNIAVMQNGEEIAVSRRRKDEFLQLVSRYRNNI
jgi:two-component system, LytTR family, response regulator